LAASIPVIAATVEAIRARWVPIADRAIIATRAHDVFTSHPPLVGQYTLAGEVTGHVTHSLGPMLFWLLAIPAYRGSTVGMTLTMGVVNTLSVVGCVMLARLRGGRVLMGMTALAIALMCQSLAAETFHDVWNPSAALFPFTLLIFLCWSLACGSYRLVPLALLMASFVVQAHLAYLPPTLGLLAVGLGGLATGRIAQRRRGAPRARRRGVLAWTLASLLVLGACWSATLVEQLTERPGNLTRVLQSATKHKATLGPEVGWHAVVHAVGVPPWWLQTPASRWQRKHEVRAQPSASAEASCIAILTALVVVFAVAILRRRREPAALALTGLVLCPALAAVAASTPVPRVLSATLGYTMWWGSQAGMTVWLGLAWGLWLAGSWTVRGLASAVRRRRATSATGATPAPDAGTARVHTATLPPTPPPSPSPSLHTGRMTGLAAHAGSLVSLGPVLAVLGAVVVVGATVAARGQPDEHAATYGAIRTIDARLRSLVPAHGDVLFEGTLNGATMMVKPAVRYFLVARGLRVLAPGSFLRLGTWYELYRRPYREAIYLSDVPRPPVKRVALAFAVSFREGKTRSTVYVWISHTPGRGGSGAGSRGPGLGAPARGPRRRGRALSSRAALGGIDLGSL
jgi:hypothetical protein